MPPKRQFSKQPAAAKKKADDDVDDKPPFAHKLCDVSRAVFYTRDAVDAAEVTITINGFVDPAAYKITLVSKGSALLFRRALPETFFDKLPIDHQQLPKAERKKMKNDSRVVAHRNLASDISSSLEFAGSPYLSEGQLIYLQKKCKNLKVESAATPTSHTVPFNGRLHQQFETVFKCLLEVADQRAEAKKPPKMQVMGRNVGSSSEDDDDDDDDSLAEPPAQKGRGGGKRRKAPARLRGGGEGGEAAAAVKAEEPIELLSSSQES